MHRQEIPEDYRNAVEYVRMESVSRMTTSLVSKRLGLGFNAAARLVERMEAEGIISPPDSSGCRSILGQ